MTMPSLLLLAGCKVERYPEDDRIWNPRDMQDSLARLGAERHVVGEDPYDNGYFDREYNYSIYYDLTDLDLEQDGVKLNLIEFYDSYDRDVVYDSDYDEDDNSYSAETHVINNYQAHIFIETESEDAGVCSSLIERSDEDIGVSTLTNSALLYDSRVDWRFKHAVKRNKEDEPIFGDDFDCWDYMNAGTVIETTNDILR